jgi:hypothetical protein
MTRKSSWTNSDGLVVGFGPNYPERHEGGVLNFEGPYKVLSAQITYQSTPASVTLPVPAGSAVKSVYLIVGSAWVGGTDIQVGDGTDPDGFISATQGAVANLLAGAMIRASGAYAIGDAATNRALDKTYAAADNIDVAFTGTFTAGTATVYVEYM